MYIKSAVTLSVVTLLSACTSMQAPVHTVAHHDVQENAELLANTKGKGFGPQSPRDIDSKTGNNAILFSAAPSSQQMNLCNIHFHKNAEHKGGEFTTPAMGEHGHKEAGFLYSKQLTAAELKPTSHAICPSKHGGLKPGDTIELHYVHSSAQVTPGPTLGSCLSEAISNPDLRVEAQVFVLVNDPNALDFKKLAKVDVLNGKYQASNIPNNTGKPVQYEGSTTGPSYNTKASPIQVSWSVRPQVAKVNASTVGEWCSEGNTFKEDHAHESRNLVTDLSLLSKID